MEGGKIGVGFSRRSFLKRLGQLGFASWLWSRGTLGAVMAKDASRAPLLVGGTVSLSGPLAPFGEAAHRALLLWREQVVARAGTDIPTILLELHDDASQPDVAAEQYAGFAKRAHVLIGPYGSRLTAAILPVCRREGIPVLLPSAGDANLDLRGPAGAPPIGYPLLPPNSQSLSGAVDWAAAQGAQTLALLFRDDPFSLQVAQGVRQRAEELHLTILWDRTFTDAAGIWDAAFEIFGYGGTHSQGANSESTNRNDSADLLVGGGYLPGTAASGFMPDALEIAAAFAGKVRWTALLVAPTFPEFQRSLGERAEGVLGNTNWKPWFPWPGNARFVAAFRRRWGEEPDTHSAAAYATGQIIEAALRRIQGENNSCGDDHTGALPTVRLAMRRALVGMETATVFGPFAVDEQGRQQVHANTILQWQNGRLARVWPLNTPLQRRQDTSESW